MFPTIGPFWTYDIMGALGFFWAISWAYLRLSKLSPYRELKKHLLWILPLVYLVSIYGGAIIPYFYKLSLWGKAPLYYLSSGRYFHSAFLAIMLYVIGVSLVLRCPVKVSLDHYAVCALMMSSIGRLGCYAHACCRGGPTTLPWGVSFPNSPHIVEHPTQLYMFGVELALTFYLMRLIKRQAYAGQTWWMAVWLYSIYRIWIEMIRTNPPFVLGMSHAQVFSIISLVISALVLGYYKSKLSKANLTPEV